MGLKFELNQYNKEKLHNSEIKKFKKYLQTIFGENVTVTQLPTTLLAVLTTSSRSQKKFNFMRIQYYKN